MKKIKSTDCIFNIHKVFMNDGGLLLKDAFRPISLKPEVRANFPNIFFGVISAYPWFSSPVAGWLGCNR